MAISRIRWPLATVVVTDFRYDLDNTIELHKHASLTLDLEVCSCRISL